MAASLAAPRACAARAHAHDTQRTTHTGDGLPSMSGVITGTHMWHMHANSSACGRLGGMNARDRAHVGPYADAKARTNKQKPKAPNNGASERAWAGRRSTRLLQPLRHRLARHAPHTYAKPAINQGPSTWRGRRPHVQPTAALEAHRHAPAATIPRCGRHRHAMRHQCELAQVVRTSGGGKTGTPVTERRTRAQTHGPARRQTSGRAAGHRNGRSICDLP
jgi:hypothetical protein